MSRTRGGAPQRAHIRKHAWSPEMIALLTRLWREGDTDQVIVSKLNGEFHSALTRNAVQGRIGRLKLPRKTDGLVRGEKKHTRKKKTRRKVRTPVAVITVHVADPTPPAVIVGGEAEIPPTIPSVQESLGEVVAPPETVRVEEVVSADLDAYQQALAYIPDSGSFSLTELSDKEERCQALYRSFPWDQRPAGGLPKFCKWVVGGSFQTLLLCGNVAEPPVTRVAVSPPRCRFHTKSGVRGSGSDGVTEKRRRSGQSRRKKKSQSAPVTSSS